MAIVLAQIACALGGIAMGGVGTKVGGALLLASFWLFGVLAGWLAHEKRKEARREQG